MKVFHIFSKFSNKYQPYNNRLVKILKTDDKLHLVVVSLNGIANSNSDQEIIFLKKSNTLGKLKQLLIGFYLLFKRKDFVLNFSKLKSKLKFYGDYEFVFNNKDAIFHFHDLHSINRQLLNVLISEKINYVVSLRGNDITIKPLLSEDLKLFTIKVLKHAWRIHSVCESLKKDAIALAELDAIKVNVIYRTPNLKDVVPLELTKKIPSVVNIVTISRVHWKKCIAESLIAIKKLVDFGYSVNYHIIGGFPKQDQHDKLLYLIEKLDLSKNVFIHGYLNEDEYKSKLLNMHICWFPSVNEGVPNTLYYALKRGFPIVASRTDGIPEVIEDNTNGLLFAPYDFIELAEQTKLIIDDDELRSKLQKNALKTKLQTEENEIKQYVSLYCSK